MARARVRHARGGRDPQVRHRERAPPRAGRPGGEPLQRVPRLARRARLLGSAVGHGARLSRRPGLPGRPDLHGRRRGPGRLPHAVTRGAGRGGRRAGLRDAARQPRGRVCERGPRAHRRRTRDADHAPRVVRRGPAARHGLGPGDGVAPRAARERTTRPALPGGRDLEAGEARTARAKYALARTLVHEAQDAYAQARSARVRKRLLRRVARVRALVAGRRTALLWHTAYSRWQRGRAAEHRVAVETLKAQIAGTPRLGRALRDAISDGGPGCAWRALRACAA